MSTTSDIHELAVLLGFSKNITIKNTSKKKYTAFKYFLKQYGSGTVNINMNKFVRHEKLFDRGLELGRLISTKLDNKSNNKFQWSATKDIRQDSSDIYINELGVSLKDSSKIIRNTGFWQLWNLFLSDDVVRTKPFDPYWNFAPELSRDYISTIIKDCYNRSFVQINNKCLYIDKKQTLNFNGSIRDLINLDLYSIVSLLKKSRIKMLVKNFSQNGNTKLLLEIRSRLVEQVSKKFLLVFKSGLTKHKEHIENHFVRMLQFTDVEKIFGFSSSAWNYVGRICRARDVVISIKDIYVEPTKLTHKTVGLQINLYIVMEIVHENKSQEITIQNQIRYKHRTFSSVPEANFHLRKYSDWQKLYPPS